MKSSSVLTQYEEDFTLEYKGSSYPALIIRIEAATAHILL